MGILKEKLKLKRLEKQELEKKELEKQKILKERQVWLESESDLIKKTFNALKLESIELKDKIELLKKGFTEAILKSSSKQSLMLEVADILVAHKKDKSIHLDNESINNIIDLKIDPEYWDQLTNGDNADNLHTHEVPKEFQNTVMKVRKNSFGNSLTRRGISLVEGQGIRLTIVDDVQNNEVKITINSTAGNGIAVFGGDLATNEPFVTIGNVPGLSHERALTGTANQITITDNGANSTVVLSIPQDIATSSSPVFTGLTLSGLTAGSVLFAGTGGLISQDNANFFWDNTNDFLGIGTASPASLLDINPSGTAITSGTLLAIDYNSASTTTAALTGLAIDLNTNVTPGAIYHNGITITIPATTRGETTGEAALVIDSRAQYQTVLDVAARTIAAQSGIMRLRYGGATTLTSGVYNYVLRIDGGSNVTANNANVQGMYISMPVDASNLSSCAIFGYRNIAGTASGGGIIEINVDAATIFTGQLVGIECDLSTSNTPGANAMIGQRILIPATTRANTAGEGALVINSDATAARVLDLDVANTSGTINALRYGAAATFAGNVTGWSIDLASNVTANGQTVKAIQIVMPAGAGSASEALELVWRGTAGTSANNGVLEINVDTATTLTGQLVGIENNLSSNVTPGSQAIIGMRILIPATTAADSALQAAIAVQSQATAARVIDLDVRNTSGTPFIMRYGAATTPNLTAMMTLDLSTNVTSNTNANIGLDIPIVAADEDTTAPLRLNTQRHFVGTGVPNNANGSNNDIYFRIDGGGAGTTHIYFKNAGAWLGVA